MNDEYINANLHNGDVISGIGLLNSHTIPQDNESSNSNDMNISVENGDVVGDYCYMNSSNWSESKNHNSIDYILKKEMKFLTTYI